MNHHNNIFFIYESLLKEGERGNLNNNVTDGKISERERERELSAVGIAMPQVVFTLLSIISINCFVVESLTY